MKKLTQSEEEIMQIIWQLGKAFVKDIIAKLPEPPPPYNTISSVVRILEGKGFVAYKAYGKTYEYYPIISKSAYRKWLLGNLVSDYFNGSYQQLVSFFAQEEQIKPDEIASLLRELEEEDKNKQ